MENFTNPFNGNPVYERFLTRINEVIGTLVREFRYGTEIKETQGNDYLETTACIDRLNEAVTPFGWSFMPSDHPNIRVDGVDENGQEKRSVAQYGTLIIHTPWGDIRKSDWGSKHWALKRGTQSLVPVDWGDVLKAAASDCLKRCARQLGMANYIYRKHESGRRPEPSSKVKDLEPLYAQAKEQVAKLAWSDAKFLEFASGVTRKTILGVGDLSEPQLEILLVALRDLIPAP